MYIESVKTVTEMTLNEFVKLTTLRTTGPRSILLLICLKTAGWMAYGGILTTSHLLWVWSDSTLLAHLKSKYMYGKSSHLPLPGFQAGPTFPTIPTFPYFFFCAPTFPYYILKMPYYPYFLVQKCLKWPKIVIFSTLSARSQFLKIRSI